MSEQKMQILLSEGNGGYSNLRTVIELSLKDRCGILRRYQRSTYWLIFRNFNVTLMLSGIILLAIIVLLLTWINIHTDSVCRKHTFGPLNIPPQRIEDPSSIYMIWTTVSILIGYWHPFFLILLSSSFGYCLSILSAPVSSSFGYRFLFYLGTGIDLIWMPASV